MTEILQFKNHDEYCPVDVACPEELIMIGPVTANCKIASSEILGKQLRFLKEAYVAPWQTKVFDNNIIRG